MSVTQSYWSVPQRAGEPAYWVCMSCLSEAFHLKVPMPDCPTCHGVSTYEAFTLEAIRDWGTEELIAKAGIAQQTASLESVPTVSGQSAD
ncbi:MAG: hypothetical protein Q8L74_07400 [Nitrospirota bacterium]|nr:hypothetical protein [Nitrospirota bacterium]MDP2381932.1 hypothetical protein [Nitrospirota bacterium]MDP3598391.1 hypothetical protein [Nitrospirota bacterium]